MYDTTDVFFCFPDHAVQKIYKIYQIEKFFMYQNLTDTDSTLLFFICDIGCTVNEKESRKMLFEVMTASKISNRLDVCDDFWQQFDVQDKTVKKKVGLYEVESIDNPNVITISVNPKEYFEKYRDKTVNKKHKGLKRDTPGMNFEAYAQCICSLHEFCTSQKPKNIKQKRFQVAKTNMQMVSVNKVQSAGLNNKRFYFQDGIVSLPFGHFFLNKVKEQKEKYKTEIQHQIHDKKYDFLKEEAAAVSQYERLRVLGSIFDQPALLYLLDSNILMRTPSINSTTDCILNLNWK